MRDEQHKFTIEIEMTAEDLYILEEAVKLDPSVNTVEQFIEKYSVLAAHDVVLSNNG